MFYEKKEKKRKKIVTKWIYLHMRAFGTIVIERYRNRFWQSDSAANTINNIVA
jgi:hypothetical protein